METLEKFGWNKDLEQKWSSLGRDDLVPARVIADFGTSLKIALPEVITAELSGKMAHYSHRENIPKVGDWVGVQMFETGSAIIEVVLPRQSEIARKVAGAQTIKQVIAANVDIAFVLLALDGDFSVERLKRFLYQLSINNIAPVIVLNKADKTNDVAAYVAQLEDLKLPIVISSAVTGIGVEEVLDHIKPAHTAILLGSSGVGKSTLTNKLLGRETQTTQPIRETDSTGKHTTIHRELFMLPGGGLLVDTPGIRELQLWGTQEDLAENFDDITALMRQCKYTNCQHGKEPECAVQYALQHGQLKQRHYDSFLKMKAELSKLKEKTTAIAKRTNQKNKKKTERRTRDIARDSRDD